MTVGAFTRAEIASQVEIWQKVIQKFTARQPEITAGVTGLSGRAFIVTGCGSTYYLALYAAAVLRSGGIQAWALPASELALFPQGHLPQDFVLLAISRSGTTSETIWAMEKYRQTFSSGGKIISITCVPDTPMMAGSDLTLLAEFAREESIAQTRSFSSMTLMVQALAGAVSGDPDRMERLAHLPQALDNLLSAAGSLPEEIGSDLNLDRFFYLGSGPYYGIACECMLKTKEMATTWSEAYHILEFRHGPMSVVGPSSLVVGLISNSAAVEEVKVLREMKAKGALTLAICDRRGSVDWTSVDQVVETKTDLSDWERPVIDLPLIQWLAFYRSLAKGLDPDHPTHLSQVVTL